MFNVHDRIKENGNVTGTGNVTLSGANTGFKTFSSRYTSNSDITLADEFYYAISDSSGNWETGNGYLLNSTTLVRQNVHESSNNDGLVSFAGTVEVFVTIPAKQINRFSTKGQILAHIKGWAMP